MHMAFDIDKYAATSERLGWDDLDLEHFRENPLSPETLRTLRYMADVEYHTVCYTRDLLTTPSHKEGEISTFMTMWNREEFWHGEALGAVLERARHHGRLRRTQRHAPQARLARPPRPDQAVHARQDRRQRLRRRPHVVGRRQRVVGRQRVQAHGRARDRPGARRAAPQRSPSRRPATSPSTRRRPASASRRASAPRSSPAAPARTSGPPSAPASWTATTSSSSSARSCRGVDGRREMRKLDNNIASLPGMKGLTIFEKALDGLGVAA